MRMEGRFMAKKKNVAPVTLSNEELVPSVIGIIEDKEKNNWVLLLFFLFLIGFIFLLPTITSYLSGESEVSEHSTSEGKDSSGGENLPEPELTFYSFSNHPVVSIDGILFQNFKVNEKKVTFDITNESEAKNYFVTHKMYLELYNSNKTFLQRAKLPSENLSKGNTKTYEFELTVPKNQVSEFVLSEKTEHDYPAVDLKKENDSTYSLTCVTGQEKLFYEFNESQTLKNITDTINYSAEEEDYLSKLTEYRQMVSKYNAIDGVKSNLIEASSGFTVTTNVDLNTVDFSDRTIQNTLDNIAYYGKDTSGKVVYFELSAMNYKCSM